MNRGWALGVALNIAGIVALLSPVVAQTVREDNTLGGENSRVTRNVQIRGRNSDRIEGGARRGQNLFHSFEQFDVQEGQGAYFLNPDGVQNIFSRVTGNTVSNINGTLGVIQADNQTLGTANLFFMNPNGILFGAGSSLDLGGSFVGTTANAIGFEGESFFRATNPGGVPERLLRVNPSSFLFNQVATPARIVNQSAIPNPTVPSFIDGLRVLDNGRSLLLLGGEIELQQGKLFASSGQIELGAIAGAGTVGLTVAGNSLDLAFPPNLPLGNISLLNSTIDASGIQGTFGGSIQLQGNQIALTNSSVQSNNFGSQNNGAIAVQANQLGLTNSSISTIASATGGGGNVNIDAGVVNLQDQNGISTFSLGQGNAGNVNIQAITINLSNQANIGSLLIRTPALSGLGSSGNVSISTDTLNIQNAGILTSTFLGQGSGGNITIQADNSINLSKGLLATSSLGANSSGNIQINARDLNIADGNGILTSAADPTSLNLDPKLYNPATVDFVRSLLTGVAPGDFGQADSGSVTINARGTIQLSGGSTVSTSTVGRGQGGNLNVTASLIELAGTTPNGQIGSSLSSEAQGAGDAGNVSVTTGRLRVRDGALISTRTFSNSGARGGDLSVHATDSIELAGTTPIGQFSSGLTSSTQGTGRAGDVSVRTRQLQVTGGATISTNALANSSGRAGNLSVRATDSIALRGVTANGSSGLFSSSQGTGRAGDVSVRTRQLQVTNGAGISTSALNSASRRGGDLSVRAVDSIELTGTGTNTNGQVRSGLFTTTNSIGRAGNLSVETRNLQVRGGAEISASTSSAGQGGNVRVNAGLIELDGTNPNLQIATGIASETSSREENAANAGSIRVSATQLNLQNGAGISTSTFGQGNAGNIMIQADENTVLARQGFITSSVSAGAIGNSGDIDLVTRSLSATGGGKIAAVVSRQRQQQGNVISGGRGRGGNIQVTALDNLTLSGTSSTGFSSGVLTLSERGANGSAGNIVINAGDFRIANGAIVVASTFNPGDAGNIQINAENFEAVNGGQVITTTRDRGQAGIISLAANNVLLSGFDTAFQRRNDRAERYARRDRSDRASDVIVNQGALSGLFASTEKGSTEDGGAISVNANTLRLNNRAAISAQSQGLGNAGDIAINANEDLIAEDGNITTSASAENSSGGTIRITNGKIRLRGNSNIRTDVNNDTGSGGNITLSPDSIVVSDTSDILAFAGERGGNIRFDTPAVFFESGYKSSIANLDREALDALDRNNRPDVNAGGTVAGTITIPDVSFIQNGLNELSTNSINTEALLANSCIARSREGGTFLVTGSGGLADRPGNTTGSAYPTGEVRAVPTEIESWQPGRAIVEPQGVYQLPDGRIVMSRECLLNEAVESK